MIICELKMSESHTKVWVYLLLIILITLLILQCSAPMIQHRNLTVPPQILSKKKLIYPEESKLLKHTGKAQLYVLVNTLGKALKVEVVESSQHPVLDQAAIDYAIGLEFRPGRNNGKATAMWMSMQVEFSLSSQNQNLGSNKGFERPVDHISNEEFNSVFMRLKTPIDHGAVLQTEDPNASISCPRIFWHQDLWYMSYVVTKNGVGEIYLTSSHDLLTWKPGIPVLENNVEAAGESKDTWDCDAKFGEVSLIKSKLDDVPIPIGYNGYYWILFLCGNQITNDDEPGIGAAYSNGFSDESEWQTLKSPLFSVEPIHFQQWMNRSGCGYTVFYDDQMVTGFPFILISVITNKFSVFGSHDLRQWHTSEQEPSFGKNVHKIQDLHLIQMDHLYVLVHSIENESAKTEIKFACSRNLIQLTTWEGDGLLSEIEHARNASNSCIIGHESSVYHFYTSDNNGMSSIELAISGTVK